MIRKIALFFLVCILAFVAFSYYQYKEMENWLTTPLDNGVKNITVTVPAGSSIRGVFKILTEKKLVKKSPFVKLVGRIGPNIHHVQKGEYVLSSSMSPLEMFDIMSKGKVKHYSFTIPEGYTVKEIARTLEEKGYAKESEIIALSKNRKFLKAHDLEYLEGYLFPDTYMIPSGYKAEQILSMMIENYRKHVTPEMIKKAETMGFSEKDIPIMASIIEKESGSPKEYVLVSSVIHNRLKKGMMLQMDPTVIYGIKDFDGNLTRKDLRADHKWNTYTRTGLPATPISNPGFGALKAAVYPADTNYLYFVSMNNGSHKFTSTLRDHNNAVQKYQVQGHKGP